MFLNLFRHSPGRIMAYGFIFLVVSVDLSLADKTISVDLFQIKRNKNRNIVQYAIYLDGQSYLPHGARPAHVFWRDLEIGPDVTNKIKFYEKSAYGISTQFQEQGKLHMRLKALPSKLITVDYKKSEGHCQVTAYTTINGERAVFKEVYVYAKEGFIWPTVKWIETRGYNLEGQPVKERIKKDLQ